MEAKETLAVAKSAALPQSPQHLSLPRILCSLTQALPRWSWCGRDGCGAQSHLCDQWRGARPAAGAEGLSGVSAGGLLRPQTEAIVGAPAVSSIQQYNFTKAFMGANGVALEAGFTTPDPEEAAVKAAAVRRARESWFLVDDAKFAKIYPAVITDLHGGAILTNRCPNPKYKQYTFVKEAEA